MLLLVFGAVQAQDDADAAGRNAAAAKRDAGANDADSALVEGKMSKTLKKMLKKLVAKDAHKKRAVADAKLGNAIPDKLDQNCVYDSKIGELMR